MANDRCWLILLFAKSRGNGGKVKDPAIGAHVIGL
jgi:hypothetical protein